MRAKLVMGILALVNAALFVRWARVYFHSFGIGFLDPFGGGLYLDIQLLTVVVLVVMMVRRINWVALAVLAVLNLIGLVDARHRAYAIGGSLQSQLIWCFGFTLVVCAVLAVLHTSLVHRRKESAKI